MAHARTFHGPGPAVQQPWMPPVAVPGYPPMHAMAQPFAAAPWQAPVIPQARPPTQFSAPMPQAHLPTQPLSQPHMAQISQPTTATTTTTASSSSSQATTQPLPLQQPPSSDTLEQKKKERDKREKERKEREMRKQREQETKKKEAHKHQQVVPKEPKQFNLLKAPSEFLCRMQFRNNLPDIPFDPKLLGLPQDSLRYTKCIIGSSLENSYKHSIFTEPDLGVPINLIDTNIYKISPAILRKLDPEDQALVDATVASAPRKGAPGVPSTEKRPRPSVSWLVKTKYLCNEEDLPQFKAKGVESAPSNYKLQKAGGPRDLDTPEGQIRAVEDTFDHAKRNPVHPTNPALHAVEILPVFPDFELWPNAYTEVVFDSDPVTTLSQDRIEAMDEEDKHYLRSNAIVRGIKGQQLVAFIAPTATRKRTRDELTEEDEEYEQVNAFHFDVAKDADLKDNYFFVFKDDGVYYNELATRVKLRKVQSKEEKAQLLSIPKPSSVHVACEDMAEETKVERDERFAELLQPASAEDAADM